MKLDRASIEWAINSLDRHSDSDLFPKPVEIQIVVDLGGDAIDAIADLDISTHQPAAPRRFIVPKDDLSYRAATQLDPLDSVLFTAAIHQFGQGIEARRRPTAESSVFSYRFSPSADGDLYASQSAWNDFWARCLHLSNIHPVALVVDISDFYNQIYHHTVENQLVASGLPNQVTKWILRVLETVSAKVSRGVPVGPHPSHLLAEASLIPIDNSLSARGFKFCRFVDDIVIFCPDQLTARTYLFQIAEILDKQQRLQLQKGKTKILDAAAFRAYCQQMVEDRPINDLENDLLGVIRKYSGGNPYRTIYINQLSEKDLLAFKPEIVEQILDEYLAAENPDYIRLRWFIRRLAQVGHDAAIEYCLAHFEQLIPALSEICYYFVSVGESGANLNWDSVGERLITLLENPVIQSSEYFQISILSLFNREPQLDHIAKLVQRYRTSAPFLRREIILAAAEAGEADWLRELKEEAKGMDTWTKRAFLYATSGLPSEERNFFLKANAPTELLDKLVVKWARQ